MQDKRRPAQLLLAAPKKVHWWLKKLNRVQLTALGIAAVVLIGGGFVLVRSMEKPQVTIENSVVPQPEPEPELPKTVPSRLTGVEVARELNDLPATAVMIENSPDARPQAGLLQADMVFEAIAEGGITRFLALYQESKPDYIGPVRSARPYYIDFAASFDAGYAHAGGSGEALAIIRAEGIKDIDHGANGGAFQRVSNRYAPHNLYTSRDALLNAHNSRGYGASNYKSFERKADSAAAPEAVNARGVDFRVSSNQYNVHYDYDAGTNSYKRVMAGRPHTDERSGAQLNPKVVVALIMPHRYAGIYSVYQTTGSGQAFVFQDGMSQPATWEKAGRKSELILKDAAGAPLKLNAGQTWLTLLADPGRVTFVP